MNSRLRKAILDNLPCVPGYLLDLPSGNGWLAHAAGKKGHRVLAGDLYPYGIKGLRFFLCDLNSGLPIRSNSIDYIYCCVGIEHTQNTHLVLSEFSRILKSDAVVILTFPNILNIGSRFKFLFFGRFLSFPHLYEPPDGKTGEYKHEHINPVSVSQLCYIASKYDLIWDGFLPQSYEMKKWVRRIWSLPVFQMIGRVEQLRASNQSKKLLWSILSSRECLLQDHVIARFKKRT